MQYPSKIFENQYSSGKEEERDILKKFLLRLSCRDLNIEDSERPDFFLRFNSSFCVGCEITKFSNDQSSKGSIQQKFISQWRSFALKLTEQLKKNDLEGIYGAIHFKESNLNISELNDSQFIAELVKLVNLNKTVNRIDNFETDDYPISTKLIEHIYLEKTDTNKLWWPAHLQSGTVDDPTDALIKIISNKCKKASSYNWENVKDKWLLIYAPCEGLTDIADIHSTIDLALPTNSFDRVFLWNKFDERISQLLPEYKNILSWDRNEPLLDWDNMPAYLKKYARIGG